MNYDNRNRGVLFPNDKGGNDQRPDYKGTLDVGGTEYELAGWIKSSKAGKKYMSLSIKPKQERQAQKVPIATEPQPGTGSGRIDDDIPF